jgi:hypothetical protein
LVKGEVAFLQRRALYQRELGGLQAFKFGERVISVEARLESAALLAGVFPSALYIPLQCGSLLAGVFPSALYIPL